MNIKSLFALSALVLASAATLATPLPTNLIQNGSFEDNEQTAGTWQILYNNNLFGWTAGKYGIELRDGVFGKAQDGKNFVELDTTKNSSMKQTVTISEAGSYQLSFWYNSRPDNGNLPKGTNSLSWSFAEKDGEVMENYKTDDSSKWELFTKTFTFSAPTTVTLKFKAEGNSDSMGGSLDNVSLSKITTPVPEPESYAMMIAGLGLMGAIARRRKQRQG
jgi:hypothetical protein